MCGPNGLPKLVKEFADFKPDSEKDEVKNFWFDENRKSEQDNPDVNLDKVLCESDKFDTNLDSNTLLLWIIYYATNLFINIFSTRI